MTPFRKSSIARHPGSRPRLSVPGNVVFTLTPLTSVSTHSAPMSRPCPRSPPAPPPSPTAGVSGSRTGTARITASAVSTDAPTPASGPPSLPRQRRRLVRILRPRSLRSRHSHSPATHPALVMVSCSRPQMSDTASLTLTMTSLHLLLLPPPRLLSRQLPIRHGNPSHPGLHHRLRRRVPPRDHDLQMSRNRNRLSRGLIHFTF